MHLCGPVRFGVCSSRLVCCYAVVGSSVVKIKLSKVLCLNALQIHPFHTHTAKQIQIGNLKWNIKFWAEFVLQHFRGREQIRNKPPPTPTCNLQFTILPLPCAAVFALFALLRLLASSCCRVFTHCCWLIQSLRMFCLAAEWICYKS